MLQAHLVVKADAAVEGMHKCGFEIGKSYTVVALASTDSKSVPDSQLVVVTFEENKYVDALNADAKQGAK